MACCEKCWGKAYLRSRVTGRSQAECYEEILKEVEESGNICTPEEQRGEQQEECNDKQSCKYYNFYDSVTCLIVEGSEFMTKAELYSAIKKELSHV